MRNSRVSLYKIISENKKKMNLPILSENRSNSFVRYRNYYYTQKTAGYAKELLLIYDNIDQTVKRMIGFC